MSISSIRRSRRIAPILWVLVWLGGGFVSTLSAHQVQVRIGGSGSNLGSIQLLVAAFVQQRPDISFTIHASMGSGGAIRALEAGRIDLALTSRPPSDNEASKAQFVEYGRTALHFVVAGDPGSQPFGSISTADLVGAYCQRNASGPRKRPIIRPLDDSDTLMMLTAWPDLAPCVEHIIEHKGIPIAVSEQQAADMLEKIPNTIGTASLALVRSEGRNLIPLRVERQDGPSELQPIGEKRLFFAYSNSGTEPLLEAFLAFMQSDSGQEILRGAGNQPLPFRLP